MDDFSSYDREKYEIHKKINIDGTITTKIIEKAKKANLIKSAAQTAKDLASGGFAKSAVANARMQICESCPRLNQNKTCQLCGCFMTAKTRVAHAKCPEGRWGDLETPQAVRAWNTPRSEPFPITD